MEETYKYRFEVKPGRFVFVPTKKTIAVGRKISRDVLSSWEPAEYFYHYGKRGGHVAAMRPHAASKYSASIDLSNFFGSVSKTKVSRSLRRLGFTSQEAFDIASLSCVSLEGKKFLPYGFPQSMVLATMAVEFSALGSALMKIRKSSTRVTMYVDDILLSDDDLDSLNSAYASILESASLSNFVVALPKCSPPSRHVQAFNCKIENNNIEIISERLDRFAEKYMSGTDACRFAIEKYIGVINKDQLTRFLDSRTLKHPTPPRTARSPE